MIMLQKLPLLALLAFSYKTLLTPNPSIQDVSILLIWALLYAFHEFQLPIKDYKQLKKDVEDLNHLKEEYEKTQDLIKQQNEELKKTAARIDSLKLNLSVTKSLNGQVR